MEKRQQIDFDWKEREQWIPPMTIILLLLLTVFSGLLLGFFARIGLDLLYGQSFEEVYRNLSEESPSGDRYFIRWSLMISHLFTFVLPGIGVALFLFRKHWLRYLQLSKTPKSINLALGGLLILAALPLAQFLLWSTLQLTELLPLPEWARAIEDSNMRIINGLLTTENVFGLITNLLVIALIPAIGEELIFRGILQRSIQKATLKPILAVWLAAAIFSLFHLQLEGFLSRLLLGALLGYLYYWTSNLWICIFAHFINNGIQIIAHFFVSEQMGDVNLDPSQDISWSMTAFSLIFVLLICRTIIQYNQNNFSEQVLSNNYKEP